MHTSSNHIETPDLVTFDFRYGPSHLVSNFRPLSLSTANCSNNTRSPIRGCHISAHLCFSSLYHASICLPCSSIMLSRANAYHSSLSATAIHTCYSPTSSLNFSLSNYSPASIVPTVSSRTVTSSTRDLRDIPRNNWDSVNLWTLRILLLIAKMTVSRYKS